MTTTITVSTGVRDRLAQAKGDRSWDEFLAEVADEYLEEAIALAERRLEELRAQKARGLSLAEVSSLRARRREEKLEQERPKKMGSRRPRGSG